MTEQAEITAFYELSQAKARYCRALDSRDWDGLAELVTADVEFGMSDGDAEVEMITGRDEMRAMLQSLVADARTVHQVHMPEIDLDGAVLGWQQWRAIEEKYGLGLVRAALQLAVAEGSLPDQPIDMLAHILLAAINEAALCIANAPDAEAARTEAVAVIDQLFAGLIPAPAPCGPSP